MSRFLRKIELSYRVVADQRPLDKSLLAWEFDPALFQTVLQTTIARMKEHGIKFDLLHARKAGSPEEMLEQGFNLSPKSSGNDWSHISIGFFQKLKPAEFPSLLSLAKSHIPTYKLVRMNTLDFPSLNYLVIELDQPPQEARLKKILRSRYPGFSTSEDKGYPVRPHVSVLGFRSEDDSKVKALIPEINKHIAGKTVKPEALQLWQDFQVIKHIKI